MNEVYVCPDGNEYKDGDIIPVLYLNGITIYNEPVIKAHCPGFPGATDEKGRVQIPPIPGDHDLFVIGPQTQVWRWVYARGEIMLDYAIKTHQMGAGA